MPDSSAAPGSGIAVTILTLAKVPPVISFQLPMLGLPHAVPRS